MKRWRAAPDKTVEKVARSASIRPVGFLFDDGRSQFGIDAPLDGRALVVLEVDGARQSDEFGIEGLRAFLVANVVLDHPQALVDAEQCVDVGLDVDLRIG